jgi:hypothetical protein
MGQKLPPEQLALYNRLDEILWNDWDPIVSRESRKPAMNITGTFPRCFVCVANERMGFNSSLADHMAIAEKIQGLEASVVSERPN